MIGKQGEGTEYTGQLKNILALTFSAITFISLKKIVLGTPLQAFLNLRPLFGQYDKNECTFF